MKNRILKDSMNYDNAQADDKWLFHYQNVGVKVMPESQFITVGDTFKAQFFLAGLDMVKFGKKTKKPLLLLGSDLDTIKNELIGHVDTIRQNVWNPIIAIKTNKVGRYSVTGIYCIPYPALDKLMYFPFKYYYSVVDRNKYQRIIK